MTQSAEIRERLYAYMDLGRWTEREDKSQRLATTSNFRMPEWTAAILLTQLERLDEQVERREKNFTDLAIGLQEIDGIEPFERDARVTRWSIYYWNFRYKAADFDGIPRHLFLKAVNAEGASIGVGGHGSPIYHNALFRSLEDCPIRVSQKVYTNVHCPEAERIHQSEALSISHSYFLGEKGEMDLILEAIRKVRENTDELRKLLT